MGGIDIKEIGAEVKKLLGEGATFETEFIKRRRKDALQRTTA
ncbi:MAG: hypothetical protein AB7J30_19165 [Hyphomicrobium sp.]